MKIKISTNLENPKYFLRWTEMHRGTIRNYTRVYEFEENMNSLWAHLTGDPNVLNLRRGNGKPNVARTQMKVDHEETYTPLRE